MPSGFRSAERFDGRVGKILLGFPDEHGITHPERRFMFSLARELKMTVGELSERMSSRELAEWIAYFKIEASEREQAQQRAKRKR